MSEVRIDGEEYEVVSAVRDDDHEVVWLDVESREGRERRVRVRQSIVSGRGAIK